MGDILSLSTETRAIEESLIMAGRKPPILRPDPTVIGPQGPLLEGLDLWRQSLRREYDRQITGPEIADLWARKAKDLRDEGARDEYFNRFYSDLPLSVIRAWEQESYRRWPRHWTNGPVDYLDIYANEDEINYTKEAAKWSMNEGQIRAMYNDDFWNLPVGFRRWYIDEAEMVTAARSYPMPNPTMGYRDFPQVPNNGIKLGQQSRINDFTTMPNALKNVGVWQLGANYGGIGAYGAVAVWVRVDWLGIVQEKIFLKRDIRPNDFVCEKERQLLFELRIQSAPLFIANMIGHSPTGPAQVGRTWLQYALFGDLSQLVKYYGEQRLVIPEPFVWYLFHTLARALHFIEKGREPGRPAVRPWRSMFHYDIKPGNILLDGSDPNAPDWCLGYPRAILTDFGGADHYPPAHSADQIPSHVRGLGTRGFSPFELFQPITQLDSNDERANGPSRDTGVIEVAGRSVSAAPLPPPRRAPFKELLPIHQPVRIHSSIFQLGVTLWCTMIKKTWPDGQICAWRGGHLPVDGAKQHNLYPAWWDQLPKHTPRRPWPWKVAKPLQKQKWKALGSRGVHAERVESYGPMNARKTRTVPPPAQIDKLGNRPRGWDEHGTHSWVPLPPYESLKPRYSNRLIDLVYRCMSPLIADRPSTVELLRETQREMNALLAQYPNGSGTCPEGLILPEDKFPVGEYVLNNFWERQ